MPSQALRDQHAVLHREYVQQVEVWKEEWLKENPPMELSTFLIDPDKKREEKQKQWDRHIVPKATEWWKKRGWKITFGNPDEGCTFEPL